MPPTTEKYIQLAEPFVGQEELRALQLTLESGWLTQGPRVREFEEAFAARHRTKYAVAVTSGTTALHLALLAVGVGPGDTVIVPSFTWIATANSAIYCGARPIFCDNRLDTYNLDPVALEQLLGDLKKQGITPKAVVSVHLFGLGAEMDIINKLAERYGFKVVEDAACAAGAEANGLPLGGQSEVSCFSFHPRKTITTGEGGMCLTNDQQIAESIRRARNNGASLSLQQQLHSNSPFLMADYNELGFNFRMSDLAGALGLAQLNRLDDLIDERRQLAALYDVALKDLDWLTPPKVPAGYKHSYQAYVCLLNSGSANDRDRLLAELHEAGIGSRAGTQAVHELGYYRKMYGLRPEDFPIASLLAARSFSLPLHNRLSPDQLKRAVEAVARFKLNN